MLMMIIMIIEKVLRIDSIIMKASRLYVDFAPCRFYEKQKNLYLFFKVVLDFENFLTLKEGKKVNIHLRIFNLYQV